MHAADGVTERVVGSVRRQQAFVDACLVELILQAVRVAGGEFHAAEQGEDETVVHVALFPESPATDDRDIAEA